MELISFLISVFSLVALILLEKRRLLEIWHGEIGEKVRIALWFVLRCFLVGGAQMIMFAILVVVFGIIHHTTKNPRVSDFLPIIFAPPLFVGWYALRFLRLPWYSIFSGLLFLPLVGC